MRVALEISFASLEAQARTGSVHVWVLDDPDGAGAAGCAALVAGDTDPYDPLLVRLADEVFLLPSADAPAVERVALGPALVYVEAVDRGGATFLSGCAAARVRGSSAPIRVRLAAPGTFDCAEPATPVGAPCDDGFACTSGESCQAGFCTSALPLDCGWLENGCNQADCDEAAGGCVVTPLTDGMPCDDGAYCTDTDICFSGTCVGGVLRDCSALDAPCLDGQCDEATDACIAVPLDGFFCSDGLYCTQSDFCDAGTCLGTPADCTFFDDACHVGVCSEASFGCTQMNRPNGTVCNDFDACTTGDACTAGFCSGVPGTEGPAGSPTCSDGVDNDCDGFTDLSDSAC